MEVYRSGVPIGVASQESWTDPVTYRLPFAEGRTFPPPNSPKPILSYTS